MTRDILMTLQQIGTSLMSLRPEPQLSPISFFMTVSE